MSECVRVRDLVWARKWMEVDRKEEEEEFLFISGGQWTRLLCSSGSIVSFLYANRKGPLCRTSSPE